MGSLADFAELKTLRMGIGLLLRSEWAHDKDGRSVLAPVGLVKMLLRILERLVIRGYVPRRNPDWDMQVGRFWRLKDERLPDLVDVIGLLDEIPNEQDLKFSRADEKGDTVHKLELKAFVWEPTGGCLPA